MDFHAEFFPKSFSKQINHRHKILLSGSCFTEQMGSKLALHKFKVLQNPNGILFNPVSICHSLISYATCRTYGESDLFFNNELWGSWQHHTRFSDMEKETALRKINESQENAISFLKEADWILLTLGSAFVYENTTTENHEVVANCHKIPADRFSRRLLDATEIKNDLSSMMEMVKAVNPGVNFIFTISPVRHLREGFIENNRSKAALIQAVHMLADNETVFYFPAYELVIDDLRDYRFYAEDMVHPNHAATNYVWEKFIGACIDESSRRLMKDIGAIVAAKNHKPFNPKSGQHKKFLADNLAKVKMINQEFPDIDFREEFIFFENPGIIQI